MDTEVLIVGAGPVGLTLSIDLGKRGIRCILIEKNEAPLGYPKMERCNPLTMEIFRRLGLADTVRAAGYPPDWPMDIYLVFDLMRPPLLKMAHPTVAQAKARRDATTDGSLPLEPYQIISQYTLEPLLKSVAEDDGPVTAVGDLVWRNSRMRNKRGAQLPHLNGRKGEETLIKTCGPIYPAHRACHIPPRRAAVDLRRG